MTTEKRTEPATITMNYYICDICGLETKSILKECSICGKHICAKCCSSKDNYIVLFDFAGYCRSCYNIKDKYETKIKQSEHDCKNIIEKCHDHIQKQEQLTFETTNKLKEQWKNESLMQVNENGN